jgi:hypothetical protein
LDDTQDTFQADSITRLRQQLAGLAGPDGAPEARVTGGHRDLGPDIWLSSDPAGQGELICTPAETGFTLQLSQGDSGAWACLGMRFGPGALTGMRYLGLLLAVRGDDVVALTPTLRYFHDTGVSDVPTALPVVLAGGGSGGGREHLAHIPVDPQALEHATGCELNLFFLRDAFVATFEKLEPLRMF